MCEHYPYDLFWPTNLIQIGILLFILPVEHSHLSTIQYFIQEIEINIKISLTCAASARTRQKGKDFSFDIHCNNFALWRTIVKNKTISQF